MTFFYVLHYNVYILFTYFFSLYFPLEITHNHIIYDIIFRIYIKSELSHQWKISKFTNIYSKLFYFFPFGTNHIPAHVNTVDAQRPCPHRQLYTATQFGISGNKIYSPFASFRTPFSCELSVADTTA